MDQTTAGILERIEAPAPEFDHDPQTQFESGSDPESVAAHEPRKIRLKPYVPEDPVIDHHRKRARESLAISRKYEALIPLKPIFRFIHEPIGPKTHSHFVGRTNELKALAERIVFSDGGSFLITGYRGVGKTSFVNEVVVQIKAMLSQSTALFANTKVLAIHLNVARRLEPAELMHHIIRGIYQSLVDERQLGLLDPNLKDELTLAFYRTSMNMTRRVSEASESGFGLNEASIGATHLKATLKTSLSYKRSRTRDDELTFLGYDDKAAEQDIIRISKALASGYVKKESWSRRWLNKIQRREPVRTHLKLVFVFDELDKLEDVRGSQERKEAYALDEILESLKTLFTTSDISFIFVAGKDLQERWLEDLGKGDSIYESIFSFEKYLPCMWSETVEICDRLVDWDEVPAPGDQNEGTEAIFDDFKNYLVYRGRGIPRRIIKGFNEHVVWQDGKPQLGFTNQQARIIRFYSGLETILRHSHERLFGNIQEELSDAQEDKRRLGIIYLVDWILRQSIGKFTLQDAANAARLLSAKIAFRDEVADNVIRQLFELLLKNDYLRQVQNPEDQTLVGGGNGHSPQYEIVSRRLAEMGSSDLFAEGELTVSPDPTPGSQLGNYFLVRELARGGMGHVFEGRDERNGRRVVVKIVASGFGQIKEVNERLKREAKILSKLDHANVVKYYDSGEANGRFFLVMDFIDGIDLGMMLRNEGKLALGFAMAIALPVAQALQYVHDRRLIRIDVKPNNILIDKTGHVYVIDFGTAKSKTPETESITQRGSFVGTPNYMSPEQLRGAPPDERSDIYSFGIVLYESIVGKKPFIRELSNVMDTSIFQLPPAPSEFVSLPRRLESLIMKCLDTDPAKRFQTMNELREELDECVSEIPLASLVPMAETMEQMALEIQHFEGMATSPSLIEPLTFGSHVDDLVIARPANDPLLFFLNDPKNLIPNGYALGDGISIGRSVANDLVLDDLKVSRYNTRIENESGKYWIEDLNPAHKTLVNREPLKSKTELHDKDRIQIGNCVFEFREVGEISAQESSHETGDRLHQLASSSFPPGSSIKNLANNRTDLLALISKVGITLLASASLNETLDQIVSLVFEAVPADRCLLMMREDSAEELRVAVARLRDRVGEVGEIRVSRNVLDEVLIRGKSVLTSDAQHDPRFASGTVVLQGIRSVLAVPLGVSDKVFGIIYADLPIAEGRFTEDHLKLLTTLASVAAIRVESALRNS